MTGNYTVIKRYADNYYSVTQLNRDKPTGVIKPLKEKKPYLFPQPIHDINNIDLSALLTTRRQQQEQLATAKLRESLSRSRNMVFEKAMCNEWDYFCTFTIDPQKYNRYQLDLFYKDFSKYINNLRNNYHADIKYLLIPEMHEDGAWHLHGFMSGLNSLPRGQIRLFNLKQKLPRYIKKKLRQGYEVFEWVSYRLKFGFCDLEPIRDKEACCKYIVKYITKDLDRSVNELHARVYYCSKGLQRATIIYSGEDTDKIHVPDHSTIYMSRKEFFTFADAFEYSSVQFYESFIDAGIDDNTLERILTS